MTTSLHFYCYQQIQGAFISNLAYCGNLLGFLLFALCPIIPFSALKLNLVQIMSLFTLNSQVLSIVIKGKAIVQLFFII